MLLFLASARLAGYMARLSNQDFYGMCFVCGLSLCVEVVFDKSGILFFTYVAWLIIHLLEET